MTTESPEDKNRVLGVAPGSQAGDELQKALDLYFSQRYHTTDEPDNDGRKAIEAYAEHLATERATEAVNIAVHKLVMNMDESDSEVMLPPPLAGEHMKWRQGYKAGVAGLATELAATLTGKADHE